MRKLDVPSQSTKSAVQLFSWVRAAKQWALLPHLASHLQSCRNPTRRLASLASHSLTESLSGSSSCCSSELREAWTSDVIAVVQTTMEVVFDFWLPRTQVL